MFTGQQIPELEDNWRYESKYRLTIQQYHQLKNAFQPYLVLDPYTRDKPDHRYLVRSLYYDSFDLRAYFEKVNGNNNRIKYRLRSYSSTLNNEPPIRVELKLRRGIKTEKLSTFIPASDYKTFLDTKHFSAEDNPVLIEFERYVHTRNLHPKLLVEYHREGYQTRTKDQLRITFDHDVSSVSAKNLFPRQPLFRSHHKNIIVLEIKHHQQLPSWLKKIVKDHNLKIVANSKYCQGIEVTHPGMLKDSLRF